MFVQLNLLVLVLLAQVNQFVVVMFLSGPVSTSIFCPDKPIIGSNIHSNKLANVSSACPSTPIYSSRACPSKLLFVITVCANKLFCTNNVYVCLSEPASVSDVCLNKPISGSNV